MSANLENSAVATGLEKVSFHSSVQTTTQLHSFHMLVRLCLISFKLGICSTWTENFQICKLGFKEAEEQEIKLKHSLHHGKNKAIPEKHQLCFTDYAKVFDWVDHNKLEMQVLDHLTCFLRNVYAGHETIRIIHGTTDSKLGKEYKAVYRHPVYLTFMQNTACEIPG